MEKRDEFVLLGDDDDYDELYYDYCDKPGQSNLNQPISLLDAIATTFNKFLDISTTVNYWKCDLDLNLNTWKNKLFSQKQYDKNIEQQERRKMLQYAVNDCLSVAELFFHMYPEEINNYQAQPEPIQPQLTSSNIIPQNNNDLQDISDDELPDICRLHFDKPKAASSLEQTNGARAAAGKRRNDEISDISDNELPEICIPRFNKQTKLNGPPQINPPTTSTSISETNQSNMLIIHATPEKINQTFTPEELQQRKAAHQRQKNEKLKWKQQNLPHFQLKIKRPIYHRYNYQKIRAQLLDDDIYTSHQLTINERRGEVLIGFKTLEQHQWATRIMKINYFSKKQYQQRWSQN